MLKDIFAGQKSLKNRIFYLLEPPGWKHDGSGKVSDDLRQEWLNSKSK